MPSEAPRKFYLTTPIYYVNARPHIGHAYTTIVADVLARRHRLLGDDVFFLTGTDEHGQKIERSAAAAGVPPQQFADQVSAEFQQLWDRMGLTYSKYIRTTDPDHKRGVQHLFRTLYERGFIYLSKYTGAYCVSDEAFIDVPVGTPCPDCGRITEQITEENFFFKLSAFQAPLINFIETGVLKVEPESRRNEVLSFLRGNIAGATTVSPDKGIQNEAKYGDASVEAGMAENPGGPSFAPSAKGGVSSGARPLSSESVTNPAHLLAYSDLGTPYVPGALKDLSISRSSFTWGIPVPEPAASAASQKHVIYVWLDALANYMTAIGYGGTTEEAQRQFQQYWPADLHLVGKEIIRFHCVYWPAFLLAAGLPLPKAITAHGWLLFDNSKMSKSKGNIVRTETILNAFGSLCPPVPEVQTARGPNSPSDEARSGKSTASAVPSAPAGQGASAPAVRPPTPRERDLFAADILRYFLLREIPFGQDGSFSFDAMVTRYNADLANGLGNLASRTFRMIQLYFGGVLPGRSEISMEFGQEFYPEAVEQAALAHLERREFSQFLERAAELVSTADRRLSVLAPWKERATASETRLNREFALLSAAAALQQLTVLLHPVLPFTAARLWSQLGLGDFDSAIQTLQTSELEWADFPPGTKLGPLAPIFPRADKGLAQIMTDMENPTPASLAEPEGTFATGRPEAPLKAALTPAVPTPVPADPTNPAAPPAILDEPSGTLPVAGSHAMTTQSGPTPSHTEAVPSAAFAGVASQTPISAGPADASPQITIDDFAKVELRVAEIKVCERIPKADKLLRLEVDLGHETRQILSGIAEFYTPEELVGRRIIVITNLAPRKMRGLDSHGMLLAASGPEGGKPILASVGEGVPVGSRLK